MSADWRPGAKIRASFSWKRIAAALGVEIAELFADLRPDDGAPPSLPAGRKRRKAG